MGCVRLTDWVWPVICSLSCLSSGLSGCGSDVVPPLSGAHDRPPDGGQQPHATGCEADGPRLALPLLSEAGGVFDLAVASGLDVTYAMIDRTLYLIGDCGESVQVVGANCTHMEEIPDGSGLVFTCNCNDEDRCTLFVHDREGVLGLASDVAGEPFFVTRQADVLFYGPLEQCGPDRDWCMQSDRFGTMQRVRLGDERIQVAERRVDVVHERMSASFYDSFQSISPDGRYLLYRTYDSPELLLKWMDDLSTVSLAPAAEMPKIAPGGRRLGWLDEDRRIVVWDPYGDAGPVVTPVGERYFMFELDWGFLEGGEWVYLATDSGSLDAVARIDAESTIDLPEHAFFIAPPWEDRLVFAKRLGCTDDPFGCDYELFVFDLTNGQRTQVGTFANPVHGFLDDGRMTIWVEAPGSTEEERVGTLYLFDPGTGLTRLLAENIGMFFDLVNEYKVLLHLPYRQSFHCYGTPKSTGTVQALDLASKDSLWSLENVAFSAQKDYGLRHTCVRPGWPIVADKLALIVDPCGLSDFVSDGAWLPGVWFLPLR